MEKDAGEYSYRERFVEKETYSTEEKQLILLRLDEERRIHQRVKEQLDGKIQSYTEEEKKEILNTLNEQRLSKQKREEIKKKRTQNKKIYKYGSKEFYKFTQMEREYMIEIKECEKISGRPTLVSLYYRAIDELKKKEVLVKTEVYSEYFYISYNPIRIYFKTFTLEDEK